MSDQVSPSDGNLLFPVFLKIDLLQILIVGGGYVGLEKLQALLKNNPNAKVTLVGKTIRPDIRALAALHPSVWLLERSFAPDDLSGTDLLILATDSRQTNACIRAMAKQQGILTNVADTPELCDFYLGSTVKKGDLKIGISTNGKSPTFAKRFRELLEAEIPDEVDLLLHNLQQLRSTLHGDFQEKVKLLNAYTASLVAEAAKKTEHV
jgi:siroheme synthase-like protein